MNAENIKAVASLWPLALICFLILLLLIIVFFFLPQTRGFLNGLKNFRFKFFNAEASVNQPQSESTKTNIETLPQEATSGTPKTVEKEASPTDEKNEPELDLDPEHEMYVHLFGGMLDEAQKVFEKIQLAEKNPEDRTRREAFYLRLRFEKGDLSAQDKLHALEIRAKENSSSWLGYIMRMDGLCYVFSRNHSKAIERFKSSANSCHSAGGRADSLCLAASSLHKLGQKDEAFRVLKEALDVIGEP